MKKIKKITYIFCFIILIQTNIYGSIDTTNTQIDDNQILLEQQEEFGLDNFIDESENFSGEFFDDININDLLTQLVQGEINNATLVQKILNIFGSEVLEGLKLLSMILAIIVIHSVLKSVSDSLESDNISKLIYYCQYILIVTVILTSFAAIVEMVEQSVNNLVGFMNVLIPLLITLMVYTGNIVSSRANSTSVIVHD